MARGMSIIGTVARRGRAFGPGAIRSASRPGTRFFSGSRLRPPAARACFATTFRQSARVLPSKAAHIGSPRQLTAASGHQIWIFA
jgi:hypothetical protein